MAASDHLSRELFFPVHRGFPTGAKHSVKKALGVHWSADSDTATKFSVGSTYNSAGKKHGVILHANVPVSSVETNPQTLWKNRVSGDLESEVPVKKSSSVFVTGVTKRKGTKTRTRRYTPPREMKA
jgi:hypothetical protein